jgi:hypothetical protein
VSWRVATVLAVLAVLAAVGIGLGGGSVFRPSPTPRFVSVSSTPGPSPSPSPLDEKTLFAQPLSAGCATASSVWLVTNGGGLLRYDGAEWAQVDSTLRSLTNVTCSKDAVYAVGLIGTVVVVDEQARQIHATDLTTQDLYGVSTLPDGALMVGSNGSVFVLDNGDFQVFAKGIDETLYDVVAFTLDSAWAVGEAGITYRLDARGWNPVGSGQSKALRAIAATSASNVLAVGDAGSAASWANGRWNPVPSGVDVDLHDVIVQPGLWIAGDHGTLLSDVAAGSPPTLHRVDLRTDCDLVSLFTRGNEIWVVGRSGLSGGVWALRPDGSLIRKWGNC